MNRVTIRRFDVVRTANVVAVLYAVAVLIVVLVFFVPFVLIARLAGMRSSGSEMGGAVAAGLVGGLLLATIGIVFYGVVGWVMTAIVCALYNFVAGRIGGIRVIVDVEGPYPGAPAYGGPGYPAGYGVPAAGSPTWPAPGSPGGTGRSDSATDGAAPGLGPAGRLTHARLTGDPPRGEPVPRPVDRPRGGSGRGPEATVANRGPLLGVAVLGAVLGVLVVVGGVVGVGPLAATTPADQVTDPREMIARSLQSVLDANAVHLEATVSGTIPGALLNRPEERVVLDGTTLRSDLRPRDAQDRGVRRQPAPGCGPGDRHGLGRRLVPDVPGRAVVQGLAGRRSGRCRRRRQPAHAR